MEHSCTVIRCRTCPWTHLSTMSRIFQLLRMLLNMGQRVESIQFKVEPSDVEGILVVNHKTLSESETNKASQSELIAQAQSKQRRLVMHNWCALLSKPPKVISSRLSYRQFTFLLYIVLLNLVFVGKKDALHIEYSNCRETDLKTSYSTFFVFETFHLL